MLDSLVFRFKEYQAKAFQSEVVDYKYKQKQFRETVQRLGSVEWNKNTWEVKCQPDAGQGCGILGLGLLLANPPTLASGIRFVSLKWYYDSTYTLTAVTNNKILHVSHELFLVNLNTQKGPGIHISLSWKFTLKYCHSIKSLNCILFQLYFRIQTTMSDWYAIFQIFLNIRKSCILPKQLVCFHFSLLFQCGCYEFCGDLSLCFGHSKTNVSEIKNLISRTK